MDRQNKRRDYHTGQMIRLHTSVSPEPGMVVAIVRRDEHEPTYRVLIDGERIAQVTAFWILGGLEL